MKFEDILDLLKQGKNPSEIKDNDNYGLKKIK